MDPEVYRESVDLFLKRIKMLENAGEICSVYLAGSFARGDFLPGRSDIDVYVVLEKNSGKMQELINNEARKIEGEKLNSLKKFIAQPFSVSVTDLPSIKNRESFLGTGFEYRNFIRDGRLLWGWDIRDKISPPSEEGLKKSAERGLISAQGMYKKIAGVPRGVLANRLVWAFPRFDFSYPFPRMTVQYFTLLFRTLCIVLSGSGYPVSSKKDAVEGFAAVFPRNPEVEEMLGEAFGLWKVWGERNLYRREFLRLADLTLEILPRLFDLWEERVQDG